jgi:hypothetical protein
MRDDDYMVVIRARSGDAREFAQSVLDYAQRTAPLGVRWDGDVFDDAQWPYIHGEIVKEVFGDDYD